MTPNTSQRAIQANSSPRAWLSGVEGGCEHRDDAGGSALVAESEDVNGECHGDGEPDRAQICTAVLLEF